MARLTPQPIFTEPQTTLPVLHRSAVATADLLAVPGTVTCTKQAGGSAAAGTVDAVLS